MPLIRLVLLLLVGGGLFLFYLQNQSTALPLVFLNVQFFNLPLALWVLTAFAAGILTTLIVAGLASLGTAPTGQARPRRPRRPESVRQSNSQSFYEPPPPREPEPTATASAWQTAPPRSEPQDRRTTWQQDERSSDRPIYTEPASDRAESDDWEDASDWFDDDRGNSRRNDWDWEEELVDRPKAPDISKERAEYEAQQPKSSSKSSSTYSYGYQDPQGSGVGKTEPVVDADYRVIVPPYRSLDDRQDDGAIDDFGEDDRDRR